MNAGAGGSLGYGEALVVVLEVALVVIVV